MAVFESLFDILYIVFVVGLGIDLTLQKDRDARLFGIMAIVLGLGDSFHLMPRVISYWSVGGFESNAFMLSWGKAVTSITMTVFYLLYYYFFKRQSGENDKKKDYLMYFLFLSRIVLILMPQNNWGTLEGNYTFAIIRNIPFTIMGIALIVWTYKYRHINGLKYMASLITASFVFYAPVVLWAQSIPALGAFMLPKTIAYFLIVYVSYRRFMPKFDSKRIIEVSFIYLIFGLVSGIFYREFTKVYAFTGETKLSKLHVHSFTLGSIALLVLFIIFLLIKKDNPEIMDKFKRPFAIWNIGLVLMLAIFMIKGIIEVLGYRYDNVTLASVAGISGLSHIVLSIAMIWSFRLILKAKYI